MTGPSVNVGSSWWLPSHDWDHAGGDGGGRHLTDNEGQESRVSVMLPIIRHSVRSSLANKLGRGRLSALVRFKSASGATAAIVLLVASTPTSACGHRPSPNTTASISSSSTPPAAAAAQSDALTLAGRPFPLHDVQCRKMGGAVLVTARTQSDESVIVDAAGGKVETLDFTADGIAYLWEPTSTGGAPVPTLTQDGDKYTVAGRIKQLHDYTKLSDFTFRATCPH